MSKRMKDKNKNVKIIFACYNTSYKELKVINILKKQFKIILFNHKNHLLKRWFLWLNKWVVHIKD